jgi:hypothetical protein
VSAQESPPPRTPPGRAGIAFLIGLAVGGFATYFLLWRTGAIVESHAAARRPLFDLLGSRESPTPLPPAVITPTWPPALAPTPVEPSLAPEPTPTPEGP